VKIKIRDITVYLIFLYAASSIVSITVSEIFFVAALICWLADIIANKKDLKSVFASPVTPALGVFAAVHLSSAVFGIDPLNSLKDYKKIYLVLAFFLAMDNFRSEKEVKIFTALFCAGSGLIGIYASAMTVLHRYLQHNPDFRANSFSGNHMVAGGMLMMGVIASAGAVAYLIRSKERDPLKTVLFTAAFILSASGLMFTFTRGSWVAAMAGIMMIVFAFDRKTAAVLVLAAAALIFIGRDTDVVKRVSNTFKLGGGTSEMERVHMWNAGLKIIKDNPLKGIGTANLEKVYPRYKDPEAVEPNAGHLHNNLIQVAVIDGLPGLAVYLWIFAAFWISLYKALKKEDNIFYKYVLTSVFAVNIGFFVNGFFEYNLFSSQVALIFWALMGTGYGVIRLKKQQIMADNKL
jgi:O-antigen ligase